MSKQDDLVQAISYDLSKEFRGLAAIKEFIGALGDSADFGNLEKLSPPEGFWHYRFEPWLAADFEARRKAVNEAFAELRPGEVLPGLPSAGPQGGE